MKRNLISFIAVTVIAVCFVFLYSFKNNPIALVAKYNPSKHTLTIKASNAKISAVATALSKQHFDLYIANQKSDFTVNGNYADKPVDEVLKGLIPNNYRYFYRVNETGQKTMDNMSLPSTAFNKLEQTGNKVIAKSKGKPALKSADLLVKAFDASKLKVVSKAKDNDLKDASLKVLPKFKTSSTMKDVNSIKEGKPITLKVKEAENETAAPLGEHVVATFRVTKNGMELVGTEKVKGNYNAASQNLAGDYVLSGVDGANVVFMEGISNPLEARSIYDPENKIEHGAFELEEGFVSVKMPKKYANLSTSKTLKVQLGKLKADDTKTLVSKFRKKQLKAADLNRSVQMVNSAKSLQLKSLKDLKINGPIKAVPKKSIPRGKLKGQ